MKFGIFYELQLPRPWKEGDEHRLYQNALDQVELADKLGYDYAWEVEHHFLEEYSHSPSPEVFLGAASQRTKNIRLGHGIYQLTTNHPARVAERIAASTCCRTAAVEFGMGESACITELEPFGVEIENKREIFEEAVQAIIPMFKEGASRAPRQVLQHAAAQRAAEAVCRSRTRRCGSPARSSTRSPSAASGAWARWASSSSRPTRRMPGCTPTTTPSSSGRRSWPTT